MNHIATRAFSTLSLALYLGLFLLVAKFSIDSSSSVVITLPEISLFSPRPPQMEWMTAALPVKIEKESVADSANFKIKEIKALKHAKVEMTKAKTIVMKPELIVAKPIDTKESFVWKSVAGRKELPVETIQNYLTTVNFNLPAEQYLALYNDFKMNEASTPAALVAVENSRAPADTTAPVEDKVSTALASSKLPEVEDDIVLYDYQDEVAPVQTQASTENIVQVQKEVIHTTIVEKSQAPQANVDKVEEVAIGDLLSFDYSQAQTVSPKISAVPNPPKQNKAPEVRRAASTPAPVVQNEYSSAVTDGGKKEDKIDNNEGFVGKNNFTGSRSSLVISAVSVDGKDLIDVKSFQVQFKDDAADFAEDFNNGTVAFDYSLHDAAATRSAKVIAKNHVTTHVDFTLEQNNTSELVPLLTDEYFYKLQNGNAVTGGLLLKVDSAVGDVQIDKDHSSRKFLDGDLKEVSDKSYEFVYFSNVPAGNVLVSFVTRYKTVRKILFVTPQELTYEKNLMEDIGHVQLEMFEDNLLSKEKTQLNINAEEMTEFTQTPRTEKLSLNNYKLPVGLQSYGSRLYLELAHQNEPIFVGVGQNKSVHIPSEDYLRLVLSNFPEGKLTTRCMVQINLSKKAVSLSHLAESVEDHLMTEAQMIDKDGRFHHSISEKTEKIFIQGEYQGNAKADPNGVIHVKVNYTDGSNDYLKTFCSPNTYLVEQL